MAPPLVERLLAAGAGRDRAGERIGVEAAAAPGDELVVDDVADAEVAEAGEVAAADPVDKCAFEHEVVVAQCEQVGAVETFRRSRQSQQETG
ncbi:MAG TPA: hypothetical protein VFV02_13505, partial [Acidimicrobiales bacterium]|nr:hypothetical protein [Acidimicrobiales bacterium]